MTASSLTALPASAALVLIDVQRGFAHPTHWGPARNNLDAEVKCGRLLQAFRTAGRTIFHIKHTSLDPASPLHPSSKGCEFCPEVTPLASEPVLTKTVNSAFITTDLEQRLRKAGVTHLVIAGLTTDHCVSTTTRMAGNLGFNVILVEDACATHAKTGPTGAKHSAEDIHEINITSLNNEFATVVTLDRVLAIV
ncbi:nicotinamidase-like amidase [Geranomyces variabilis]|nr:nicotinamidase-like amidase [Geranomyces variabilis]KAJ3135341.1 hypothetical protein HDU90_004065 [Geranomyces variabilis]